jgi:uncharacterized sulfatase
MKSENKLTNVLLITSDQQHWNTIGAFNNEIKTPNLDRLVKQGAYFSRAYTVNPTCTPTRASIITGKMPSQHGAWTLGTKLPETENTLGDELIKNGYRTALIGKAHFQQLHGTAQYPSLESYPLLQDLEFWKNYHEKFYGFEYVELARNHTNEAHVGQHYALWMERNGCKNWRDYFAPPTGNMKNCGSRVWDIPEKFHYDAWIAEGANAKLEEYRSNGERFFLWASFLDPHPPYLAPEPYASMYDPGKLTVPKMFETDLCDNSPLYNLTQTANPDISQYKKSGFFLHGLHSHLQDQSELKKDIAAYYGMITLMDKYIGKILDKLDELGLSENTLVIFTTDHGHFYGHHGLIHKGPFMYDDLIKVPFIARHPGAIPQNTVNTAMQSLVDIAPTILDFCGLDIPVTMSGKSQRQVWEGFKDKARDHIICEHNHERDSINLRTYLNERYKVTIFQGLEYGQLYDMQSDPDETLNLWNQKEYAVLKTQLLQQFLLAEMAKEAPYMERIASC